MVSSLLLVFKSSSPFINPLGIVPRAPISFEIYSTFRGLDVLDSSSDVQILQPLSRTFLRLHVWFNRAVVLMVSILALMSNALSLFLSLLIWFNRSVVWMVSILPLKSSYLGFFFWPAQIILRECPRHTHPSMIF